MLKLNTFFSPEYLNQRRFVMYYYQFIEIINLEPETVMEIGIGNGILTTLIRSLGCDVTTLDNSEVVKPDILGSVTDIPVEDNSFDVVAAFQILEHIPYDEFLVALGQLQRVSKKHVVISVPDAQMVCSIEIKAPKIGTRRLSFPVPIKPFKKPGKYHHWEINRRGYALKRVVNDIEKTGFKILKTYRPPESNYCRMFVLETI